MSNFAQPVPKPSQFTYSSAENRYEVYGWTVSLHRDAREFSTLGQTSCDAFSLSGSGSGTVTTPGCFKSGARYTVTLDGQSGTTQLTAVAGRDRRLAMTVPLGAAGGVYTTTVTIRRASSVVKR